MLTHTTGLESHGSVTWLRGGVTESAWNPAKQAKPAGRADTAPTPPHPHPLTQTTPLLSTHHPHCTIPTGTNLPALLARAKALVLPKNPLDDLIERLGGPDAVAEMTGRAKRMEAQPRGGYSYVSRSAQYGRCSLDDVSVQAGTAGAQAGSACVVCLEVVCLGPLHAVATAAQPQ